MLPRILPAILLALPLLAGCTPPSSQPAQPPGSQSQTTAPAPRRGGVLRSAELGGAPQILHPYPESQQLTTPWSDAATLMWASLIDFDTDTLDYIAAGASSTHDHKRWTYVHIYAAGRH